MSTSLERLGELRTALLPHVIRHLAETSTSASTAELSTRAVQCFDAALSAAQIFHRDHLEPDEDVHLANLMQFFVDEGIPPLASLPVIDGFVFSDQNPAAE